MTLKLIEEKNKNFSTFVPSCLKNQNSKAHWQYIASFPAVPLGPLFYRALEETRL